MKRLDPAAMNDRTFWVTSIGTGLLIGTLASILLRL